MWQHNLRIAALAFGTAISTTALADTMSFDLIGFDGISASDGLHVSVSRGDAFEITAESDSARQLGRLELDVRGTTLLIGMENRPLSPCRNKGWRVNVSVTLPNLVGAEASSGSEVTVDMMIGSALELAASSGALLQIEATEGEAILVDLSSGAQIEAARGTCGSMSAQVSSGAIYELESIECRQVEVDASNGSAVVIYVEQSINATASSGATIKVRGTPELTNIETSSGGAIEPP